MPLLLPRQAWFAAFLLIPGLGRAQDTLTAILQYPAANGFSAQTVTLSSPTQPAGALVPLSQSGLGTRPLVTFNWKPTSQLRRFNRAAAAGLAIIATIGDSTTRGHGAALAGWTTLAYPAELAQSLTRRGIPAQSDNFLGNGGGFGTNTDFRVTLIGAASFNGLLPSSGGPTIQTTQQGDGVTLTLDVPTAYNRALLSYLDSGSGTLALSADGVPAGPPIKLANSGNILVRVVPLSPSIHSSVSVQQNGTTATNIQGISLFSTTRHAVQVMNAGIGGWTSEQANSSTCLGVVLAGSACGFGQTAGTVALHPSLVFVNLGINDIVKAVPEATTASNIAQIVATLQAAGSDVIILLPTPFSDPGYAAGIVALRADLQALAVQANIGLIDLSATYNDDFDTLSAQGLMGSSPVHPDATLYADIADGIAALIASAQ